MSGPLRARWRCSQIRIKSEKTKQKASIVPAACVVSLAQDLKLWPLRRDPPYGELLHDRGGVELLDGDGAVGERQDASLSGERFLFCHPRRRVRQARQAGRLG